MSVLEDILPPTPTYATAPDERDTRHVQVKAAVRPAMKKIFEELADRRGKTMSDLIQDLLIIEAEREGLLAPEPRE